MKSSYFLFVSFLFALSAHAERYKTQLKSLAITGTLKPAFDPEQTRYRVKLRGPHAEVVIVPIVDLPFYRNNGLEAPLAVINGKASTLDPPEPQKLALEADGTLDTEIMIVNPNDEGDFTTYRVKFATDGMGDNLSLRTLKIVDEKGVEINSHMEPELDQFEALHTVWVMSDVKKVTFFPGCFEGSLLSINGVPASDGTESFGFDVLTSGWEEYFQPTSSEGAYLCEGPMEEGLVYLMAFAPDGVKVTLQAEKTSIRLPSSGTPAPVDLSDGGEGPFFVRVETGPASHISFPTNIRVFKESPLSEIPIPIPIFSPETPPETKRSILEAVVAGGIATGTIILVVVEVLILFGIPVGSFSGGGGLKEGASGMLSVGQITVFALCTAVPDSESGFFADHHFFGTMPVRLMTLFFPFSDMKAVFESSSGGASQTAAFLWGALGWLAGNGVMQGDVGGGPELRRLQDGGDETGWSLGSVFYLPETDLTLINANQAGGCLVVSTLILFFVLLLDLLLQAGHWIVSRSSVVHLSDGNTYRHPFTKPHKMKFGSLEMKALLVLAVPICVASAVLFRTPDVGLFWIALAAFGVGAEVAALAVGFGLVVNVMRKKRVLYVVQAADWTAACEPEKGILVSAAAARGVSPEDLPGYRALTGGWEQEGAGKGLNARMMQLQGVWTDRSCDQLGTLPEEVSLGFCCREATAAGDSPCLRQWTTVAHRRSTIGRIRHTEAFDLSSSLNLSETDSQEEERLMQEDTMFAVPSQIKEVTLVSCRPAAAFWAVPRETRRREAAAVLETSWMDLVLSPEAICRLYKSLGGLADVTRVFPPSTKGVTYGEQGEDGGAGGDDDSEVTDDRDYPAEPESDQADVEGGRMREGLVREEQVAFLKVRVNTQQLQGPLTSGQLSLFFEGMRLPVGRAGGWLFRILVGLSIGFFCGQPTGAFSDEVSFATALLGLSTITGLCAVAAILTFVYWPAVRPLDNLMNATLYMTATTLNLLALLEAAGSEEVKAAALEGMPIVFISAIGVFGVYSFLSGVATVIAVFLPRLSPYALESKREQWELLGLGDVDDGESGGPVSVDLRIAGSDEDVQPVCADRRQTVVAPKPFEPMAAHTESDDDCDWMIECKGVPRCAVKEVELQPTVQREGTQQPLYSVTVRTAVSAEARVESSELSHQGGLSLQLHVRDLKNALMDIAAVPETDPQRVYAGALTRLTPNLVRPVACVFAPGSAAPQRDGEWRHINFFSLQRSDFPSSLQSFLSDSMGLSLDGDQRPQQPSSDHEGPPRSLAPGILNAVMSELYANGDSSSRVLSVFVLPLIEVEPLEQHLTEGEDLEAGEGEEEEWRGEMRATHEGQGPTVPNGFLATRGFGAPVPFAQSPQHAAAGAWAHPIQPQAQHPNAPHLAWSAGPSVSPRITPIPPPPPSARHNSVYPQPPHNTYPPHF
uniref:Cadherin-like beta sandwich domain-containing protein n=1 Tax=Chromera velia CCMP2878 TaxID=1169474 RepID=A0A0G4GTV6_9ALVE|eukprot:Cvel_5207.t1-p1 / transcript=Cvel_5207.t1 / gene=Cvel_5207 / organism=Chromera_velia_CCMP2878 / gene_product=hypothetical protein / transcript_product=hypothetical protein / location=Cvel_scaffold239:93997-104155(+) / protein_length=1434 / sequence_SO=supercontig / SO=protein_coding / is_pseudo=false